MFAAINTSLSKVVTIVFPIFSPVIFPHNFVPKEFIFIDIACCPLVSIVGLASEITSPLKIGFPSSSVCKK